MRRHVGRTRRPLPPKIAVSVYDILANGRVVREIEIPDHATLDDMKPIRDVRRLVDLLHDRYGREDLADVGGPEPAERREMYRALLSRIRDDKITGRRDGNLGWDTLVLEEAYEVVTEQDDDARYIELIQLAAGAICWADAIKRRKH
jgi:hypothetical protein